MPIKKQKLAPYKKADSLILWKANAIVFVSSFCVMVIEIVAARIMAPYIGVSLYTWTTIIGVILADRKSLAEKALCIIKKSVVQ